MARGVSCFINTCVLLFLVAFGSASISRAESLRRPDQADSPFDLVNAVNELRLSYGLMPYSISSILMYTAQAQADFLAATGSMTHSGPGGIGLTDRLLAAGYPLAGDLSLGGFRAENITGGNESMTAQAAVNAWTRDAPHLNTMISPDLTEIGAGVAVSNGRVYYVIDAAQPATSGSPPAAASSLAGGSAVPAAGAAIVPVSLSTPNADGHVIHEVMFGQTLWQIAIAYGVNVAEIQNLNNLPDDSIYPGEKLLVQTARIMPTASPTETPAVVATSTSTRVPATAVGLTIRLTSSPVVVAASVATNNSITMKVALGIIVLGLLGGALFAWLVDPKKK